MTRALPFFGLLLLAACYDGPTVVWDSKYFADTPQDHVQKQTNHRQIEARYPDGRVERLGYLRTYNVKPAGYRPGSYPGIAETFDIHRIFDDDMQLIGRMDDNGQWYRYPSPGKMERLGDHELYDALRLYFKLGAYGNVYLGPIDKYRGR